MGKGMKSTEAQKSQIHATKDDRPQVKTYQLIMIGCATAVVDLGYGIQSAYMTPILIGLGVPIRYLTLIWIFSPVMCLLTQPFVGSYSDSCTCSWGRRRPFILGFGICVLVGLMTTGFGRDLGTLLQPDTLTTAIIITIIGNTLLGYSLESIAVPGRAYLFDVAPPKEEHKAQRIAVTTASLAAVIGYVICGVNWNSSLGIILGGQIHSVYVIATLLTIILIIISLFSVKEVPYKATVENDCEDVDNEELIQDRSNPMVNVMENKDYQNLQYKDSPLKFAIVSVLKMPREFVVLSLLLLMAWIGYISFAIFYTDYIGIEFFHGDPAAAINTTDYLLYEQGIQAGSWALLGQSILSALYSMLLEVISKYIGNRMLMFGALFVSGLCLIIMILTKLLPVAIISGVAAGLGFATMYSMPFGLVDEYHVYFKNDPRWRSRGFGVDVAILNGCAYISQIIVSLCVGAIVEASGTRDAAMYVASGSLLVSALLSFFIVIPSQSPSPIQTDIIDVAKFAATTEMKQMLKSHHELNVV